MRAETAHDLRVSYVDIRVMIGSFRRARHGGDETDSVKKILELECLRDDVAPSAPAWEIPELTLDRNVR